MSNILILGSTGLLGSCLVPYLKERGHNLICHSRKNKSAEFVFDLSDLNVTLEFLAKIQPSVIVNLVGMTSVEHCQKHIHESYLINTRSVENIVRWTMVSGSTCHLIQISTDQVYDGFGPHIEENVTLTNTYALTKYAGEIAAGRLKSTILRTNFVGRSKVSSRESLTDWVYKSLTTGQNVQVLADVLFSPLSMNTLVEVIDLIICKKPIGVYNLGSKDGMSKADFDFKFAEILGLPSKMMSRINSSEANFLKAYRPKDMRMNCYKFENAMGIRLPTLEEEIEKIAKEYI